MLSSGALDPVLFHVRFLLQSQVDFGAVSVTVSKYTFTYIGGSGPPLTFSVPSVNCNGGVCQNVFNIPTSSVSPSYTVSVTATNVAGEGPANTSQPISEQKAMRDTVWKSGLILIIHQYNQN